MGFFFWTGNCVGIVSTVNASNISWLLRMFYFAWMHSLFDCEAGHTGSTVGPWLVRVLFHRMQQVTLQRTTLLFHKYEEQLILSGKELLKTNVKKKKRHLQGFIYLLFLKLFTWELLKSELRHFDHPLWLASVLVLNPPPFQSGSTCANIQTQCPLQVSFFPKTVSVIGSSSYHTAVGPREYN